MTSSRLCLCDPFAVVDVWDLTMVGKLCECCLAPFFV